MLIKKANANVHLGKLTFVGKEKGKKTRRIYLNLFQSSPKTKNKSRKKS